MEIYVGNLSDSYSEEELKEAFEAFGHVESVKIIKDPITHESKGFGFVIMKDEKEAQKAIIELDGQEIDGKIISVKKAHKEKF